MVDVAYEFAHTWVGGEGEQDERQRRHIVPVSEWASAIVRRYPVYRSERCCSGRRAANTAPGDSCRPSGGLGG